MNTQKQKEEYHNGQIAGYKLAYNAMPGESIDCSEVLKSHSAIFNCGHAEGIICGRYDKWVEQGRPQSKSKS